MKDDQFDASEILAEIKEFRRMARRKRSRFSKLLPFRMELVELRRAGATIGDLVIWLRKNKRMRVAASTVSRYLQKLPELQEV
ncbi:MAG: hypothetical protein EG824_02080 [Deltaproteobacteria bacterium]|nr:hypothetical protein [Deltaproteobacteria bacterium]